MNFDDSPTSKEILTLEQVRGQRFVALRDRLVKRMAWTAAAKIQSALGYHCSPSFVPSLAELGYVAGFISLLDGLTQ